MRTALAAAACGTCATCVRTATPGTPAIANAHKCAQMHSLRFTLHVSLLTPCTHMTVSDRALCQLHTKLRMDSLTGAYSDSLTVALYSAPQLLAQPQSPLSPPTRCQFSRELAVLSACQSRVYRKHFRFCLVTTVIRLVGIKLSHFLISRMVNVLLFTNGE